MEDDQIHLLLTSLSLIERLRERTETNSRKSSSIISCGRAKRGMFPVTVHATIANDIDETEKLIDAQN